jgi:hypothetical protein
VSRHPRPSPSARALFLGLAVAGCAADPGEPACVEDQCEGVASRAELLDALAGHGDPVAAFLRDAATARGTLEGDYRDVLEGVGGELGCAVETERRFVVLSNHDLVPKTVVARCADDPQAASRFFAAVPALREVDGARDVDPQTLHLSAWDADVGSYRTYATRRDGAGELSINVSPSFCLGCHGGPHRTGFWQPLMNEMTNPWSGWNAAPGFRSQLFDEWLDDEVAAGPTYGALTAPDGLDSASNLEPIVRAGIDRVVAARLERRKRAPDLEEALALARPLFCDETINFVSESHGSGELRIAAAIDRTVLPLLAAAGVPQAWAADVLRLPAVPAADGLTLVPTRGESTAAVELGLVARGVLAPIDVLRVRALDHARPAMSRFRCGLWETGAARIRTGALDDARTALPPEATTADLLPLVLEELLRLPRGDGFARLAAGPGDDVVAFADADDPETALVLAAGDPATLGVSLATLGDRLGAQASAADREVLGRARRARACAANQAYPTTPIYPDAFGCD